MPLTIHNPVQDDTVTFVQRTDGRSDTVVDVDLAPGGGTELHTHTTYAEHFTCTAGLLELAVDGELVHLRPGESASAPIGSVHRFHNPTGEPTAFRAHIVPGHAGFERTLIVSYGLATDGRTSSRGIPRNPLHLGMLTVLSDTRLVGGLRVLNPVLGLLARLGRVTGAEARALARYDPDG